MRHLKEGMKFLFEQTSWAAIATLAMLAPLSARTAEGGHDLIPRCGGPFQLCGYVEKDYGVQRIPQQFEVAKPFSEGLAAVRVEGLYGFIDSTGKIVIEPRFQNAGFFTGEYAEIRLDNASGIVNRTGVLVVLPQFRRIIPFVGDTFIAQPFLDNQRKTSNDNERLEAITNPIALSSYNDSGLFHTKEGWLSDQKLKFKLFDKPERGLIWAGTKDKNYEDIWGLMRTDGTWQVTPRYHHVQSLRETHAVVESMPNYSLPRQKRREALRRGAVDRDGNLVVPLKFAHLSYWRGGYGIGSEGKPFDAIGNANVVAKGIVRADGTLLADRYFDDVDVREDGRLPRGLIGKTWYRIDPGGHLIQDQLDGKAEGKSDGKRVEKPAREALAHAPTLNCDGGLRFFEKSGLWGLQDIEGKTVIEPRFRALSCFKQGVTWVAAVDGNAWCPIGPNGNRRDAIECDTKYYPSSGGSHSRAEKFSDDPYESSVLWNRAWLDYLAGKRHKPPEWIPGRKGE